MEVESFDLLSSMSPKIGKSKKTKKNKAPSVLALKKRFRRSSVLQVRKSTNNHTITIVSSDSSNSDFSKQPSIIELSDSSDEKLEKPLDKISDRNNMDLISNKKHFLEDLSDDKFLKIKSWVDEVNNAKKTERISDSSKLNVKLFYDDNVDNIKTKNSDKSFDEDIISDSDENEDIIPDSQETFKNIHVNKDKNKIIPSTPKIDNALCRNKQDEINETKNEDEDIDDLIENNKETASLLDSLYGNSWRANASQILPSSEPRPKKQPSEKKKANVPQTEKPKKILYIYSNPYLDSEKKTSNNLLNTLHKARLKKALESPWRAAIQKLCDSDSSSDDNFNSVAKKLDFDEKENNTNALNVNDEKTKKKTKTQNTNIKSKKKFFDSDSEDSDSSERIQVPKQISKPGPKSTKPKNHSYTFLESLSKSVPINECDMSARIFRNNFQNLKDELVKKLFTLYNENIFDNKIPADSPIIWNDRMRGTAGFCYCRKVTRRNGSVERHVRIALSTKVLDSADRVRDTLVHEMCHAATWIINEVSDGHGPFWQAWTVRAMRAFPELPQIKRCHQYVINTKYTYRCVDCGYSIGRHSKSLDIERKRCGHCYGKFEVLINKINKDGEKKTVPSAKKQANGFALFVKENYSNYKKPDLKHGDVMKILGQKFAELKVDKN